MCSSSCEFDDRLIVHAGIPRDHDRIAAAPDREATLELAELLSGLRPDGAIFLRGEYSESWAYESMPSADAVAILAPEAQRVLLFHVIASGRAWIEVPGGERHWANAGDVIVLPYNDEHRRGGARDAELVSITTLLQPPPWTQMPVVRHGGGGAATGVICGYLICDDPLFDPRLRAVPPVFVVSPPAGPAREWVKASIDYALQQTTQVSDERLASPTRVPELLLVEILKLHLASAPSSEQGWLRATRDPVLAPALAAIHSSPGSKWSVAELAGLANVSTSLLDERLRDVLGLAPGRYVSGWRMHTAENLLRSSDLGIAAVARQVGYESEEAFSRAFKRDHGVAPSVWRVQRPQ